MLLARHYFVQRLACIILTLALSSGAAAQGTLSESFSGVWTPDLLHPTLTTPDGRFSFAVRARMQFDGAIYGGEDAPPDLTSAGLIRRAYLGVEGRAFRDFWYEYRMDFGGRRFGFAEPIINIARLSYNVQNVAGTGSLFRINAGLIKPIFTYNDSVSSASLTFLERAGVVNAATMAFGGATPRLGFEVTFQKNGNFRDGDNLVVSGALTGGDGSGVNPGHGAGHGTQMLGRFAYYWPIDPSSGIQFGSSTSRILHVGSKRSVFLQDFPEIHAGAERLVSTGAIPAKGGTLWGLESAANFHNLYVAGEYYELAVERDIGCASCNAGSNAKFSGWYVEGSWILTGETKTYVANAANNNMATFSNPHVGKPLSLDSGGWGAWEVATRYSDLDLNWHEGAPGTACPGAIAGCIRGGEQKIWTFGLNWYVNDNVRLLFDYMTIDVDRLDGVGLTSSRTFNVVATRVQFAN